MVNIEADELMISIVLFFHKSKRKTASLKGCRTINRLKVTKEKSISVLRTRNVLVRRVEST